MNQSKFHKEVGFEEGAAARILAGIKLNPAIRYTRHAQPETIKDRYQIIPVVKLADLKAEDIFEYTKEGNQIVKAAFRVKHLSPTLDFIYSVSLDGNVLTCWANTKEDSHRTLNRDIYQKA